MSDTIQMGFPMPDGSMQWTEPAPVTLDSKANLLKRWKEAGNLEAHKLVEVPGGLEVEAHLNSKDLAGIRQRLIWDQL